MTNDITASAGDVVRVDIRIKNTGDASGDQDITLDRESTQEDKTTNVQLDSGAVHRGMLTFSTSGLSSGDYTCTVASADDSETFTLTIS